MIFAAAGQNGRSAPSAIEDGKFARAVAPLLSQRFVNFSLFRAVTETERAREREGGSECVCEKSSDQVAFEQKKSVDHQKYTCDVVGLKAITRTTINAITTKTTTSVPER